MADTISVPFEIRADGGIKEANPPGAPSATVVFHVAASDRYQFVKDLLGYSVRSNKTIIRHYPFRYPPSPQLICTSIESIEFFGKPLLLGFGLPWMAKNMARISCNFTVPTWDATGQFDASGQPYTTTTFSIGADRLTVPKSVYKFSGGVPTNTNVALNIPLIQISMKRHLLPYVPLAEMAALSGGVNDSPLAFLDYTFDTGTVLFMGGDVELAFDTAGNIQYECTYKMSWRYVPWNKFLHPNGTTGFATVADGGSNPPYRAVDLTTLP